MTDGDNNVNVVHVVGRYKHMFAKIPEEVTSPYSPK